MKQDDADAGNGTQAIQGGQMPAAGSGVSRTQEKLLQHRGAGRESRSRTNWQCGEKDNNQKTDLIDSLAGCHWWNGEIVTPLFSTSTSTTMDDRPKESLGEL